jgi:hypothetical protein
MRHFARWFGTTAVLTLASIPAAAQRPQPRADSVPLRADYRDLNELLSKLPKTPAPTFDESQAVALGAIQLSCIDKLQPRVPPRPEPPRDSTARRDSVGRGDSAAAKRAGATDTASRTRRRGPAAGTAAPNNSGAGYLWVTTYSLVPNNNQTRAFWGCTDWHSAVSSTWATVNLIKSYPKSPLQDLSREKLADHLGASNLNGELAFFHANAESINPIPFAGQRPLFERPYGFAWLLKLQSELNTWPDSAGRKWVANVAPLANWMSDSLGAYITTLPVAVRSGNQGNTALSLMLALDYAKTSGDAPLRDQITTNARRFYLGDKSCKTQSEAAAGRSRAAAGAARAAPERTVPDTGVNDLSAPGAAAPPPGGGFGGGDIVSPCLTEAALMSQVLSQSAFVTWLNGFLPPMQSGRFSPLTEPAGGTTPVAAADRVRLSGLSFQRAQAMERIAHALPVTDARVEVLHRLSAIHAQRGFELMRGDVTGVSWLPAYALLYIDARKGL